MRGIKSKVIGLIDLHKAFCGDIYGHHVSSHFIRLELEGESLKLSSYESKEVHSEYRSHHLSFSKNWNAYDVFD